MHAKKVMSTGGSDIVAFFVVAVVKLFGSIAQLIVHVSTSRYIALQLFCYFRRKEIMV